MKYTIKKVAELAGITPKTLRHYEKLGLIKPLRDKQNGYRIYEQKDLERLQAVMFYKELDFPLAKIKRLLDSKGYDAEAALCGQITLLTQKIERLEAVLALAKKTLKNLKGEITMTEQEKFEAFKEKLIKDNENLYGDEVAKKFGKEAYLTSVNKLKSLTKEQYKELENLAKEVNDAFIEAKKTGNPESPQAKKAVELHKKWLMYYWPQFSKEAYAGLANTYADDPRFAAYYDKLGEGMAVFVRDSILEYIKTL